MVPPRLVQFVEAHYPSLPLEARVEATVELRLTVMQDGHVAAAEVVQTLVDSPGVPPRVVEAFEAAAQAAAGALVFSPATKDGVPTAARVLYRYEFLPPVPATTSKEAVALPDSSEPATVATPSFATPSVEVTVHGESAAEQLRNSAESVKVIETDRARREAADLAEVLSRTQGVGVRRTGGMGSDTSISLNGFSDDQVRFFLDGVPLELSGYPFGLASVPVNLVQRVEIYTGVVPVRFGADALGGAINLVTDRRTRGTHASGSYEVGSFGTHSVTFGASHGFERSGFFVAMHGFADGALNDYSMKVEATDDRGQLYTANVERFHDEYLAGGLNAEVGWVNRAWAKRFSLRGFASKFYKQYQHDYAMIVPYGGVDYSERTLGANLRYEYAWGDEVSLDAVAGYSHERGRFLDVDPCLYDWFGRCLLETRTDGETDSVPHDSLSWDQSLFGRFNVQWLPHEKHALRLSLAPTYFDRSGEERRLTDPNARDPLSARRRLYTLVTGLEYQTDLFADGFENILFVKQYAQYQASEDPIEHDEAGFGIDQEFETSNRDTFRWGWGNGLRYRFTDFLLAKAAYELATRLPTADEVFGDNAFVLPNIELVPESSHNFNLGGQLDWQGQIGQCRSSLNLFLRDASDLISLLPSAGVYQAHQNIYAARSQGIEAAAGWTSPRDYLAIDGNVTYQDFRNVSTEGRFSPFEGDRIPNTPYFFANGSVRFQLSELMAPGDQLSLSWYAGFVKGFYRSWESVGKEASKQKLPDQWSHTASLVYVVRGPQVTSSASVEVQNITDARLYDFFGTQPGRGVYLKGTLQY